MVALKLVDVVFGDFCLCSRLNDREAPIRYPKRSTSLVISVLMSTSLVSSTGPFTGSVSIEGTSVFGLGKSRDPLMEGPGANFKSPNASNALILHIWEFTLNAVSHHLVQMVLKGPTVVWYCQIQNFDRTTTVIHLKISNPLKAYWEFSVKNNSIKFH